MRHAVCWLDKLEIFRTIEDFLIEHFVWSLFSRTSDLGAETLSPWSGAKPNYTEHRNFWARKSVRTQVFEEGQIVANSVTCLRFNAFLYTKKNYVALTPLYFNNVSIFLFKGLMHDCFDIMNLQIFWLFHACLNLAGNSSCFAKILLSLYSKTCWGKIFWSQFLVRGSSEAGLRNRSFLKTSFQFRSFWTWDLHSQCFHLWSAVYQPLRNSCTASKDQSACSSRSKFHQDHRSFGIKPITARKTWQTGFGILWLFQTKYLPTSLRI